MDKDQIAEMIRKRLNLEDQEWSIIQENPKFQQLFQNAIEAAKYRLWLLRLLNLKAVIQGMLLARSLSSTTQVTCSPKKILIECAPF